MTAQSSTRHLLRPSALFVSMALGLFGALPSAQADGGVERFVESATFNADGSVTLPLHEGTSQGRSVWYVLLDASDGKDAASLGINQASKL